MTLANCSPLDNYIGLELYIVRATVLSNIKIEKRLFIGNKCCFTYPSARQLSAVHKLCSVSLNYVSVDVYESCFDFFVRTALSCLPSSISGFFKLESHVSFLLKQ